MINWNLEEKLLPLKYTWKISRNESTAKTNFFIHIQEGQFRAIGETAPNVRYGDSTELIHNQFNNFLKTGAANISTYEELVKLMNETVTSNALKFGIESAFVHLRAKIQGKRIYEVLGLKKPENIFTSYTLPIMDVSEVGKFIKAHDLQRFKSLKIKVNADNALDLVNEVARHSDLPIRIDANECWKNVDEVLIFSKKIQNFNIEFLEQPLPYNFEDEYIYLKNSADLQLIADESITDEGNYQQLSRQFHGINMKLMKAGGYYNGLKIIREAQKFGMKTMVGCMIESSLGISCGMHFCGEVDYVDLDGSFVIENEPFNLIKEKDGQLFYN
ncbi:MAG: dipeptide epimerase [Cytophagaceae bacterium]